jgi:hypothetical protein
MSGWLEARFRSTDPYSVAQEILRLDERVPKR